MIEGISIRHRFLKGAVGIVRRKKNFSVGQAFQEIGMVDIYVCYDENAIRLQPLADRFVEASLPFMPGAIIMVQKLGACRILQIIVEKNEICIRASEPGGLGQVRNNCAECLSLGGRALRIHKRNKKLLTHIHQAPNAIP